MGINFYQDRDTSSEDFACHNNPGIFLLSISTEKITTMGINFYQARDNSSEDFASHNNPGSFLFNTR